MVYERLEDTKVEIRRHTSRKEGQDKDKKKKDKH
jgi:hypothetical protein